MKDFNEDADSFWISSEFWSLHGLNDKTFDVLVSKAVTVPVLTNDVHDEGITSDNKNCNRSIYKIA